MWGERLPIACGMSTGSFGSALVVSAVPLTVCLFDWPFVPLIKCIHTPLQAMLIDLLFVRRTNLALSTLEPGCVLLLACVHNFTLLSLWDAYT